MTPMYLSPMIIVLVVILIRPEGSFGLGINCRGSIECAIGPGIGAKVLERLSNAACEINGGNQFWPGQHITQGCFENGGGGIAVFTQRTDRVVTAEYVCRMLRVLRDHGCGTCGSIPFDYESTNDVNNGEITVNYVNDCN